MRPRVFLLAILRHGSECRCSISSGLAKVSVLSRVLFFVEGKAYDLVVQPHILPASVLCHDIAACVLKCSFQSAKCHVVATATCVLFQSRMLSRLF